MPGTNVLWVRPWCGVLVSEQVLRTAAMCVLQLQDSTDHTRCAYYLYACAAITSYSTRSNDASLYTNSRYSKTWDRTTSWTNSHNNSPRNVLDSDIAIRVICDMMWSQKRWNQRWRFASAAWQSYHMSKEHIPGEAVPGRMLWPCGTITEIIHIRCRQYNVAT